MERWLCGFNRSWLYREERGPSFMREKSRKTSNLARIWSRKIAESRESVHPGQNIKRKLPSLVPESIYNLKNCFLMFFQSDFS